MARGQHARVNYSDELWPRIIKVHAGGRHGFIPGALLTYKAAPPSGTVRQTATALLDGWRRDLFQTLTRPVPL